MIRHLKPSDYRQMAWKNGAGVTVEIAREPEAGERFDWRVSVADVVSDGEFSRFEGIDRVIIPIEGEGMELIHNGRPAVMVRPLEPHPFDGDNETYCRLIGGAIRDFNLMTRRGRVFGSLKVIEGEQEIAARLLYCVRGSATVRSGVNSYALAAGETLIGDAAVHFAIQCATAAAVIAVLIVA